jgi:hypothetical protein
MAAMAGQLPVQYSKFMFIEHDAQFTVLITVIITNILITVPVGRYGSAFCVFFASWLLIHPGA